MKRSVAHRATAPVTKRRGGALIEQHTHLVRAHCTASRVLEDRTNLLKSDAGEPLHEEVRWRIVLKILEECGDRHAGTAEHPCPAVSLSVLLDRMAAGPVNHATKTSTKKEFLYAELYSKA